MTRRKQPLVPPGHVRRSYAERLPPGDALALETLFSLRATAQAIDNVVSRWLGEDALTPGRWQVLAVLWSRDRPVPQREIVDALKVSRANVSMLIDALRGEGHVSAIADPGDGRQVLVALTEEGRTITDRLVRDTARRLRATLALDDEELRRLVALTGRLLG
ncbi:MarR family winged helix-turn-helix transcriptional regulator [Rhizosaccharibacter radicis]|uniref:MarR family transcriptional regulator n=1 Tax=Rhizosaccharibacter radicis TaxID=2782605 RepID=A0ABT1VU61_9PROT|nr:MarR family transcriptional regulator [Acetobacteraceae bacterium KSS12]